MHDQDHRYRGRGSIDQGAFTAIDVEYTVEASCNPVSRVWEWAGTFRTATEFPVPERGAATLRVADAGTPIVITASASAGTAGAAGAFLGCGAPPSGLIPA